ncbi:serine/threonine protein phosphatase [Nonomuraea aridisoli]|uniref:Serine/threonine protein phosphatase n=2 Tax=Nonomuraea aridisoli TaxID=2070368 RepID=A0A2W2ERQ4_9ACTN|nr:serine/threonine protein phosphatase [Nonomuraea aridisoli]
MLSRGKALLSRGMALLSRGMRSDSFDSALVGVAVTSGSAHRLIYMNHAFRKIFGEGQLGVPIREAFRDLCRQSFFAQLDRVLETGEAVSLEKLPLELGERDPSGRESFASVGISKLSLGDGDAGLLIMTMDVTDRVDTARMIESVSEERRRFLHRYQSLAALGTQAIWVNDPQGKLNEPSHGWERYTGQSWEEYRGHGWLNAVHPDDREHTKESWLKAVEQPSPWDYVYRLKAPDGTYRHVRARSVPIVEGGQVVEWLGTIADVEQEWQEERRRKLLDQAAAATAGLASLEEVLRALSEVIVPTLSDGCGIYVLPECENQSTPPSFVAELLVSIARTREEPPSTGHKAFGSDYNFGQVVSTRRPVHWEFPKGKPPPGVAPPGIREWFIAAQVNSVTLVPVVVDGAVAAVVVAVVCGDREPLCAADVDLLGQMLDHAHAHLSNAMRFQHTQRVALALQNCLLPDPPKVPGVEITVRYRACAAAVEIGGDWYDSFVLPDGSTVLSIGDVAGHDLAAAVMMSQLRNMLRGLAMDRREPPGDTLRRLNVATESLCLECMATCVLARLEGSDDDDGWRLNYSVAGHPPPLLVTHHGEARYLEDGANPLLGVTYDTPRSSAVAALPARSTLLLYTDGLVEVPGEHLGIGLERLRRSGARLAREPLEAFCDKLLTLPPMPCKDDIAMIAVRLPGVPSPTAPEAGRR